MMTGCCAVIKMYCDFFLAIMRHAIKKKLMFVKQDLTSFQSTGAMLMLKGLYLAVF